MRNRKLSKRRFGVFSIGLIYLIFLHNFAAAQTAAPVSPEVQPKTEIADDRQKSVKSAQETSDYIHFGDLIDVDVIGSTEYDWRGRLSPEGFLSGIGFVEQPIYALCRAEEAIAADVAAGFAKILKDPQVSVKIIDRSKRPFSLLYGAVRTPQRFQIRRPVRLNELLILSGGITEKTSGDIQILRPPNLSCASDTEIRTPDAAAAGEVFVRAKQNGESKYINVKIADLIKGDAAANPLIVSGDVVTVLESDPIYVIGGVINPKQINARARTTVSRAVDSAGGFAKNADRKRIRIFRREKSETKIIEVDYEKIESSPENDIVLQAFDVIEVAETGRERKKTAPVVVVAESKTEKSAALPLRVID